MNDYTQQPRWAWVPKYKGWVSRPPATPEEDFHEPYIDGWDLI